MSDKDSSTLKSYVDSYVAAGQSALGSLTGNTGDKVASEKTSERAAHTSDASHSVSKLGPFATTPSGGMATDSPQRSEGSYNQTVGAAKESLGKLVGAEGLARDGARQNAEGKEMEAEGQLKDYGHGMQDRVTGGLGGTVKGLMGDREGEDEARRRHDDGKAAQRSAEKDIMKQNQ